MTTTELAFVIGDVLQTEPSPGYWGCAVVLGAASASAGFYPRFIVGITPLVFQHRFEWPEINQSGLTILQFERSIRIGPGEYATRSEHCIGIYTARSKGGIRVLGNVDANAICALPLTFDVGDGTGNAFPLYGPMRKTIGGEAVIAWRRIHDAANLSHEISASRKQFEMTKGLTK
jgi:hypothetical protein